MKRRPYLSFVLVLVSMTVAVLLLATRRLAPSRVSSPPAPTRPSVPAEVAAPGPEAMPEPPPADTPVAKAPATDAAGESPVRRQRQPGEPLRIPADQPIPEIFPHEKERDTIQSLAATYDAKRIPEIAAFLDHADPLVREAARNGLLQLSSPEAVPVLRAAAAKARNAEEAAALREAADFLEPDRGPG